MLLRLALEAVDRIVNALPAGIVYWAADVAGDAWRRFAPDRRRLVAANLTRVCEATGRPTGGPAFRAMLRDAFRNHARYYAELVRAPNYDVADLERIVAVPDWDSYAAVIRAGATIIVSSHLGNFEPFGALISSRGHRPLAPVEEIEPRALFEFLSSRRGGGAIDLVPLRSSRSAMSRRLREGGVVGVLGDRVVAGASGSEVVLFGHPARIPNGPATLAVTHRTAVIVGRCLRTGPDRFEATGEVIDVPTGDDRRADIELLTQRVAAHLEHDIGSAPEQWWGAFQPVWPDLTR